ncbi:MAG: radical SAM protein, partial [Alphaproteobacteria bacterium]|nr:radical SAM protein [Alphaproteobacteria bacterium]
GAIEICFLGQNVNGYKFSLDNLIRETAKIDSIERIRFTSSYPTEMTDDLIALFGTEPKLLPFLNMPIQSGSPDVLTRMNRPYSLELYIDIVNKLLAARPDIQISSDFIVGFPGETDEDFEMTCDIARRIKYINSYSFKYSPRPHTPAAQFPNQIPENIKKVRLKILDEILTENNRAFNESCIGREMECLIEGPDKTGKHLLARTPYMQQVIIAANNLPPLQKIRITSANKCSLRGEIINLKS